MQGIAHSQHLRKRLKNLNRLLAVWCTWNDLFLYWNVRKAWIYLFMDASSDSNLSQDYGLYLSSKVSFFLSRIHYTH